MRAGAHEERDDKVRGNQAQEVRAACRELNTTPEKLKQALRAVGYDGEKVRRYLSAPDKSAVR